MISCGIALWLHGNASLDGLILVTTIGIAYWFGYAVNDYFDAPDDALDERDGHRNPFVGPPIPAHIVRVCAILIVALICAGFARFGAAGLAAFSLALLVVFAYSAPPARLKHRPGWDVATHALFVQTYPFALGVVLMDASWQFADTYIAGTCLLASMSGQVAQQIRDIEVDARTGSTFVTALGERRGKQTLVAITVLLGVVVVLGLVVGVIPRVLAPLAVAFLPAFVARVRGVGARSQHLQAACSAFALLYAIYLLLRVSAPLSAPVATAIGGIS